MDFGNLSTKYLGGAASNYESERVGNKWQSEHAAVEQLLSHVGEGAKVLDIPVGTGRLIPYYKSRGFKAYGLDISADMLAESRARAEAISAKIQLAQGDIRAIPFDDGFFDLVVCLRFLNWIDKRGVEKAVAELARVSRRNLLIGIRYLTPFADLGVQLSSPARLAMRLIGFPQNRARRWGLVYHDKSFIDNLFSKAGLEVVEKRHVERRLDGTDYVFFLLKKAGSEPGR